MSSKTHFETIWEELSKTSFLSVELKTQLSEAFTKAQFDVEGSTPFESKMQAFWQEMDKHGYGFSEGFKVHVSKVITNVIAPAPKGSVPPLEKKEIKTAAKKTSLYQNLTAALTAAISGKPIEKEKKSEADAIPHLQFVAPAVTDRCT
jgi:hypothetical protein